MKRFVTLLILTAALPLAAKVYWPGSGRGNSAAPRQSFAEESGARHQMSEPVIFNGVSTEVKVFRLQRDLTGFLEELRRRFPALTIRESAGGTLLYWQKNPKWRERILLVATPGSDVVTAFSIVLPEEMPPMPPLPEDMPPLPGAAVRELMKFPERNSTVVNFTFSGGRENALLQSESWLRSRGFVPLTGEIALPGAKGEIYRNSKSGELFLISVSPDGSGTMMRSLLK